MHSRSNYFKIIEHNENIEKIGLEKISIYSIYNDISKMILSNISKYRIKHREILEKYVRNKYLLEGIIVGDIDNVDENIKENFKDINSYHLLAISGSHMAYLMVIIEFMVKKIKIRKRKYKHYYNINNWNVYCSCRIFTCGFKSRDI